MHHLLIPSSLHHSQAVFPFRAADLIDPSQHCASCIANRWTWWEYEYEFECINVSQTDDTFTSVNRMQCLLTGPCRCRYVHMYASTPQLISHKYIILLLCKVFQYFAAERKTFSFHIRFAWFWSDAIQFTIHFLLRRQCDAANVACMYVRV